MTACWAAPAAPAVEVRVPRGTRPEIPLAELQLAQWTKSDGLPTNTLIDVVQTRRGYVWVAGFGGAARFDGVVFESFNQQLTPELEASSFYEVLDLDETILLASQGAGIWKLENNRFAPAAAGQPGSQVRCLHRDSSGVVWAGFADRGVARLEGDRWISVGEPELAGVTVRDIVETAGGVLWIGTEGRGLARLEGDRPEIFTTASGLVDDSVSGLAEAADGGLWIGTQSGLSRLRDGEISTVPGFAGLEIFDLAEDDYGSLWVAAEQGLFRRHRGTGRVERLAEHRGRSLRSINGLALDHEGGVWISSYTSGLFQLRESAFVSWTRAEGLASDRVNSVFQRRDGSILVGADQGIVQVLERGELSRLPLARPLPEVRVRNFLEDRAGDLWISSYAGVLKVGKSEQVLSTTDGGLPTNKARFVHEDRAGRRWIGTRGAGLVEMTGDGRFEMPIAPGTLASDFVLALAEDPTGRLLIGTQGGLSVLQDDGGIHSFTTADGLPGNLVFNIRVDAEGAAWLATTGGLARFVDGRIDAWTVRQGLPAEAVYDSVEDDLGHLWLTSSEGVIRVRKSELDELFAGARTRIEARLFDASDGMADPQCTGGARIAIGSDGGLWFPTMGGLSRVDPRRIPANPIAPPVFVRSVRVDGKTIDREAPPGELVAIGPGARRFEFSFSALSFQAPSKVDVRYRLDGFDDDWMRAGRRRTATYTQLPPGEFAFRVIAANRDGVWNDRGASFAFRVRPHYTQRPAFLLLVALALVAVPWPIFRWRLRIAQRRSDRLQELLSEQRRLESERARLVGELERRNEQLENLTHAVSHDLKSPLVTIHGFVGALERDIAEAAPERVERDLGHIRKATAYMGSLLEQLNRVRRLESSEAPHERVDLARLAREALAAVAGRIQARRIQVEVDSEMPPVFGDRLQLTEVLQNLLDNAARFVGDQPNPRIEIGWRRDGNESVFFVRDNGIGIEPRYQEQVFGLFQRLDHRHEGTGVGLTIVKRVVEAHGGRVWVESEGQGTGTAFCFTLPAPPAGEGPDG